MSSAPPAPRRYGFVGVGTMSSAIVRGLCTLPAPPPSIVLSPRGAEKAAALKAEFGSIVTVATSNQDVVDNCDVVFIGVLPKQTEEVIRALKFDKSQTVCSLVSTAPMSLLHECCAPVAPDQIVRAIPLPPVAKQRGACVMTPQHDGLTKLFDALGTCVAVPTEAMMKKMMPVSCLMGQFYAQQRATQQWLQKAGVDADQAAAWTGAVFHCITYDTARPNVKRQLCSMEHSMPAHHPTSASSSASTASPRCPFSPSLPLSPFSSLALRYALARSAAGAHFRRARR